MLFYKFHYITVKRPNNRANCIPPKPREVSLQGGCRCSLPFLEATGFGRTLAFCWLETWARARRQRNRQAPRSAMPLLCPAPSGSALPADGRLRTGSDQKWLFQKAAR